MRKIFTLALLSILAIFAYAQQPKTFVRTFGLNKGTFTQSNPLKTYHAQWKSTATAPQLILTDEENKNNMWTDSHYDHQGEVHFFHRNWLISTEDGYIIKSYRFKFKGFAGADSKGGRTNVTVTPKGGKAVVCKAGDEYAQIEVNNVNAANTSFEVANDNMVPTDFEVVIEKSKSAVEMIETTTIENGQFAPHTLWYAMTLRGSLVVGNTGVNQPLQLKSKTQTYIDDNLWAFTGNATDGFTIYNRSAGTDYVLVSPKSMSADAGGQAFVKLMKATEVDPNTYVSQWKLEVSNNIPGEKGFYFIQKGSNAAANDRNGKLAFWTGGRDEGSTFILEPALLTYDVQPGLGTLQNAPNKPSAWYAQWTSHAQPSIVLSALNNNMQPVPNSANFLMAGNTDPVWTLTAPKGYVIDSYSFTISGKKTVVTPAKGGNAVSIEDGGTAMVSATNVLESPTTFNLKNAVFSAIPTVSKFTVVIRKHHFPIPNLALVFDNSGPVPYRIPGIAQARDGHLIAVADYRYCKADIGNGAIDLRFSISNDHGKTWTAPQPIAKSDPSKAGGNQWDYAFGDPSIVADRESDEVLVMCVGGHVGYFGSTRQNPQHVVRIRSHNGGQTWEKPEKMTEEIYGLYDVRKSGKPAGIFLTSGRIMQSKYIKVGKYYRLYIAHPLRGNGDGAYVIYSDDFGETWHVLGDVNTVPCTGRDESKVEELPDGSVLLSTRAQWGGRMYNVFTYSDPEKAKGKWGKEVMPELMKTGKVNQCNGAVLVLPAIRKEDGKKVFLTLQSVPMSSGRVNVGFFYKEIDGFKDFETAEALGAGWKAGLQVSKTSSCYSSMIKMDNDTIAFLYEESGRNGGYNIMFRALSVEDITKGNYTIDTTGGDRTPYLNRNFNEVFVKTFQPWFDTAGQYFSITEAGKQALQAQFDALSQNCSLKQLDEFETALKTYIQIPENGFYRLRQNLPESMKSRYPVLQHYMGATTQTIKGLDVNTFAQSPATVVYLKRNEAGNFTLALQGGFVETAAHAKESSPAKVVAQGGVFEARLRKGPGKVAFYATEPNHESNRDCLHLAAGNYDMVAWTDDADASQWQIEKANSIEVNLPISFTENGKTYYFGTLYVPFSCELPDGVIAATGLVEDQQFKAEEHTGRIPMQTAMILRATTPKVTLKILDEPLAEAPACSLTGTFLQANRTNEFVLGNENSTKRVGFFRSQSLTLPHNTAYFKADDATQFPHGILLAKLIGTSIQQAALSSKATCYDLQGRPVQNLQQGHLYIVNGQKFLAQ